MYEILITGSDSPLSSIGEEEPIVEERPFKDNLVYRRQSNFHTHEILFKVLPFFVEKPTQVVSYQVVVTASWTFDYNNPMIISLFANNLVRSCLAYIACKHQLELRTMFD